MGLLNWFGLAKEGKPLEVGTPAPDISARDEHGKQVRLSDFYRDGFTLIYFYPKAETPGCTKQACSLRDGLVDLKAHGIRVVGVSADTSAAQLRFQQKHHLPYTLIADEDRAVATAFGVPLILGMAARQSFLIHDGTIVWRDLHASTVGHTEDVLQAAARFTHKR